MIGRLRRLAFLFFLALVFASSSSSNALASNLPSSVIGQIAGALSTRAYLPRSLPTGFLYTDWQRSSGVGGYDLTVHYAAAGKRLTWQVQTHSDSVECSFSSFGTLVTRVGSLKVYGSGDQAWTCVGVGKTRFEVEATSKALPLASLVKVVGSAKLAPQLPPAQVTVSQSAYQDDSSGTGGSITYELELHNASTVVDALGVKVTVTFVDSLGRSLATDDVSVTGIPAGGTVYAIGLASSSVTLNPTSLQSTVAVDSTQPKALQLPPVTGVKVQPGQFETSVTGNLTNPYSKPLPTDATIDAIYLDTSGKIIGGDETDAGASVQPNATVGFSFPYATAGTASALVSVDPCGALGILLGGQCPALSH